MLKQIKFFKLKHELSLPEVKLGDSIEELIHAGFITEIQTDDKTEYSYSADKNISIGSEEGNVSSIFFARNSVIDFLKLDVKNFAYPATDSITEHFSQIHERLDGVINMDDLKAYGSGNYLVLIFADSALKFIFLKRVTDGI
jgi:hypothetical protein